MPGWVKLTTPRGVRMLSVSPGAMAWIATNTRPWPAVAESGVASAADARTVAGCGYRVALIGTALMGSADPAALLDGILRAGRTLAA